MFLVIENVVGGIDAGGGFGTGDQRNDSLGQVACLQPEEYGIADVDVE